MRRSVKIALISVLSFGIVGGAFAYGKHKFSDPSARMGYIVQKVSKKLDLDDVQTQALQALKDELVSSREQFGDKKDMKEEMKALITADTFDQGKALELVNGKTSAVNETAPTVIAALGNFLDTLNADQKAQIAEFMDRGKKWKKGHKHDRDGDDE